MSMMKRGLLLGTLITIISIVTIYYTVDRETVAALSSLKLYSIGVALICLAIGMYFDGLRLQRLVAMLGYRLSLKTVLRVIFGNYFMAMLTPGATGGPLIQMFILKHNGIPMMEAAPIVFIRTIFSILFLCAALPFVFMIDGLTVPYISNQALINASIGLIILTVVGIFILQTKFVKAFLYQVLQRTKKESLRPVLYKLEELNRGFSLLYKRPIQSIIVFIESGLSLLFLYAIAPALMLGFTGDIPLVDILSRMIVLNLILYFAPTPGGAGVAEGLFVYLMSAFLPMGTVGIVAVGWRVIAEYIPFFVGMYGTLTMYGFVRKNDLNER